MFDYGVCFGGMLRGYASGYASPKSNTPALHKLDALKKERQAHVLLVAFWCFMILLHQVQRLLQGGIHVKVSHPISPSTPYQWCYRTVLAWKMVRRRGNIGIGMKGKGLNLPFVDIPFCDWREYFLRSP